MSKEFYPSATIESLSTYKEPPCRSFNSTVTLLLRSHSPKEIDDLTPEVLQTLNSAAVIAAEAARTCYSPALQTPEDYIKKSDKYRSKSNEIIISTKESGHLTTRQHVHYTFALEGVSRHAVNYLHSQPYYNSEEVSQRYVNLKDVSPIIPDLGTEELNKKAKEISEEQIKNYNTLFNLLIPTAKDEILKRYPGRNIPKWESQINEDAKKKAQEIARYLLPLGTPTNLYFTISELTLIRLNHLKNTFPTNEVALIVDAMVATVAQVDPTIYTEIDSSLPRHCDPDVAGVAISHYKSEFDELIQDSEVLLDNQNINLGSTLARSVRLVLGKSKETLTDSEAISLLLDPSKNKLLTSVYGEIVMDHLSQCLNQINISALVSLSHTANYQLQRHRGLNHTTPLILEIPDLDKDIVIPNLLNENPFALAFYLQSLETNIESLKELELIQVSLSNLQYLLPNATRVRKSISGPLGAIYHLIKSRTCLTAQEEIYNIAVSLAKQITTNHPELSEYFYKPAPCGVRSLGQISPKCPEGNRFCGVRVWDLTIDKYPNRTI